MFRTENNRVSDVINSGHEVLTERHPENYIVFAKETESRGDRLELRGNGSVAEQGDRNKLTDPTHAVFPFASL